MVLLSDYHLIHVTLCKTHVWEDLCFILKLNQYVLVWNEHIVGRDRAKHCRRGGGGGLQSGSLGSYWVTSKALGNTLLTWNVRCVSPIPTQWSDTDLTLLNNPPVFISPLNGTTALLWAVITRVPLISAERLAMTTDKSNPFLKLCIERNPVLPHWFKYWVLKQILLQAFWSEQACE